MTARERTWVQRNLPDFGNRRKQIEILLGFVIGAAWVPIMVWLVAPVDPMTSAHAAGAVLFRLFGSLVLAGVMVACGWCLGRRRRQPIAG